MPGVVDYILGLSFRCFFIFRKALLARPQSLSFSKKIGAKLSFIFAWLFTRLVVTLILHEFFENLNAFGVAFGRFCHFWPYFFYRELTNSLDLFL